MSTAGLHTSASRPCPCPAHQPHMLLRAFRVSTHCSRVASSRLRHRRVGEGREVILHDVDVDMCTGRERVCGRGGRGCSRKGRAQGAGGEGEGEGGGGGGGEGENERALGKTAHQPQALSPRP